MKPAPTEILERLAHHSREAEEKARRSGMDSWTDDLSQLSEPRRASWRRILSSVATTEGLEGVLIAPLIEAKREDTQSHDYLESHEADECRHHELLTGYLKSTFGFEKRHRTLADQVLYDRLLPAVAASFRRKPLYGFALLYCYEHFSIEFYRPLHAAAEVDGAHRLAALLKEIEKDELRHVAGMECLLRSQVALQGGVGIADRTAVGAILSVMLADVDMRPWAVHNREVRGCLERLGIDPLELTRQARRSREETLSLLLQSGSEVLGVAN